VLHIIIIWQTGFREEQDKTTANPWTVMSCLENTLDWRSFGTMGMIEHGNNRHYVALRVFSSDREHWSGVRL
jgi:hypothetical protein